MAKSKLFSKIISCIAAVSIVSVSALGLFASATEGTAEAENLLAGKTPTVVKLAKSDTQTYSEFTEATVKGGKNELRTSENQSGDLAKDLGLGIITDGIKGTDARIWFDWIDSTIRGTTNIGLIYDLGDYFNVTKSAAYFAPKDASKGYVQQYTVYGGAKADNSMLNNKLLTVKNDTNASSMEADAIAAGTSVRYILIVFDKVPTVQNQNGAMSTGCVYISELEVYATEESTEPVPAETENLLFGLIPTPVRLAKSDTFVYDKFEEAGVDRNGQPAFRTDKTQNPSDDITKGMEILTDGVKGTDARIWFDWRMPELRNAYNIGLIYDLGGYFDVTKSAAYFAPKDASKGYVQQYTVYGGAKADNSMLNNKLLTVKNDTNASSMEADATAAGTSVRYILIVFDKVPTVQNQNGAMGTGTVYMSELEVYGTEGTEPALEEAKSLILNKKPAMIQLPVGGDGSYKGFTEVTTTEITGKATHALRTSQNQSGDLAKDMGLGIITDGVKGTDRIWFDWMNHTIRGTTKIGLLYDLGGWYDLTKTAMYFSTQLNSNNAAVNPGGRKDDGRDCQQYSVYGGPLKNSSILDNKLVTVNNEEMEASMEADITMTGDSVRYIMIVFDKLPTQAGTSMSTGCVYMSEVEVFGTEGVEPEIPVNLDFEIEVTDEETGITFKIVSQGNPVEVAGVQVTKKDLTTVQQGAVSEYGLFAPYGVYHFDLLGADGNVIQDMTGRTVTVSIPYIDGTEVLSYYNADDGLVVLDANTDTENELIIYNFAQGEVYFDLMMLTVEDVNNNGGGSEEKPGDNKDDSDINDENNNDDGDIRNENNNDGSNINNEDNNDTGVAIPVIAMVLVGVSAGIAFVIRKKCVG